MRKTAFSAIVLAAAFVVLLVGCHQPVRPVIEEPYVVIDYPPASLSGDTPVPIVMVLGRVIKFTWHSGTRMAPDSLRSLLTLAVDAAGNYDPDFDVIGDLETNPSRYEDKWSRWFAYPYGSGGKSTVLGDDASLWAPETGKVYLLAVQAKNRFGMVTTHFSGKTNARLLVFVLPTGPTLTVAEPHFGSMQFLGADSTVVVPAIPPGTTLNFTWQADASSYGGEITSYRYGWDVDDVNDPSDWAVLPSPFNLSVSDVVFYSGTHTLFVEAADNSGAVTIGRIEISVIPWRARATF